MKKNLVTLLIVVFFNCFSQENKNRFVIDESQFENDLELVNLCN